MSYTNDLPKYSTDPVKVLKKSVKVEDHCQGFLIKQIADIEVVLAKSRETSSTLAIQLNNKPDSPFYGLKHMTKFQTLKYIADKFDMCDDMVDLIYKKLKQQTIYSLTSPGTSQEVARIPRNIIEFMSRPTWNSTYIWRQQARDSHRFLFDECQLEQTRRTGEGYCRNIIISENVMIRVCQFCIAFDTHIGRRGRSKCEYIMTIPGHIGGRHNRAETWDGGKPIETTLKKDIQKILEYNEIPFKKSWTKSKMIEELVK